MTRILTDTAGGIARLQLNDPATLNAIDAAMLDELAEAVRSAGCDPTVRLITLTGVGRGFCSGAKLSGEVDPATLQSLSRVIETLHTSDTPVLAAVNGVAAGAGMSLALACDYVLATDSAFFMLAFSRIALMPDGAATALVAASIGRARAMRLALSAERVPARVAADWGLIAESCPDEEFAARLQAVETTLAGLSPAAAAETKHAVNAASMPALTEVLAREEVGQTRLLNSPDFAEGLAAFAEKRPPRFGA